MTGPSLSLIREKAVYAIGTMDTKGEELSFLGDAIRDTGMPVHLVDVGTGGPPQCQPCISRQTVAEFASESERLALKTGDRGAAVKAMSKALERFLCEEVRLGRVAGVVGVGGTGGTALLSPAFQALPFGLPKVIVSTVASGNTAPYIGMSDLILIPSVVDVAGLNTVSRAVLLHAAHAVAGMCSHGSDPCGINEAGGRTAGITMFGVTTPCVTEVRNRLGASGWEALVFHATGTGGRTMEKLAGDGMIQALLDLTTTEVADEVVGGVFPAGKTRFDLLAREPIPCVMSLGALDMVNFGHRDTVPPQFRHRMLYEHNAQVTLMRTTADECRAIAQWMAAKINRSRGPLTLLIPEKGLSAIDTPGHPFHAPDADAALFEELRKLVCISATRQVISLPLPINDPGFAEAAVNELQALTQTAPSSS